MTETPWTITNNTSGSLYLGEGVVVGGGGFRFELSNGAGSTYNADYIGLGAGTGIGLPVDALELSRNALQFFNYILPILRSPSQLASVSLGSSNLYIINDRPSLRLGWEHLNDFLILFNLSGELGLNIAATGLIWVGVDRTSRRGTTSVPMFRASDDFVMRTRHQTIEISHYESAIIAGAVMLGLGVGLVGAALTGTFATCQSFERA
ncbi:MAG: hypothetical protein ACK5NK_00900 [Niabella sp.]